MFVLRVLVFAGVFWLTFFPWSWEVVILQGNWVKLAYQEGAIWMHLLSVPFEHRESKQSSVFRRLRPIPMAQKGKLRLRMAAQSLKS